MASIDDDGIDASILGSGRQTEQLYTGTSSPRSHISSSGTACARAGGSQRSRCLRDQNEASGCLEQRLQPAAAPARSEFEADVDISSTDMGMNTKSGSSANSVNVLHSAADNESEKLLDDALLGRRTMRAVGLRVLPVIGIIGFAMQTDVQLLAFSSISFIEELGMKETDYGLIITATFISNTIFMYPSAVVAKAVGARWYLTSALLFQGVVLSCTLFVHSFDALVALRVVLGAITSGVMPAMMAYLSEFYGKSDFGTAWARSFNIGSPLGSMLGAPLAALLMRFLNWKWVFVAEGVLIFAAAVPTFAFLPSGPSSCRFLNAAEQRWLSKRTDSSQSDKREESETLAEAKGEVGVLASLLMDYRIIIMCIVRLLRTIAVMGMMFFTPLILEEEGLSPSKTALSMSLMIFASIILGQIWATHSDATQERIWHSTLGLVMMFVGLCVAPVTLAVSSVPVWATVVSIAVARCGVQMSVVPFQAFLADVLPKNAANAGMALVGMSASAAGIVSPVVVGALRSQYLSFSPSLLFMAACVLLAIAAFLPLGFIYRRRRLMKLRDIEMGESHQ